MQYIVILERTSLTPVTLRVMLRADVPAARQVYYADATLTSAFPDTPPEDLVALRAGQVTERTLVMQAVNKTPAQVKAELVESQQAFQAEVSSQAANQWKYYGTYWDGTSWTDAGVN